ncbi:hypothetical protein U3516DRAFT_858175 [Neocallimastix sp. 'constans']
MSFNNNENSNQTKFYISPNECTFKKRAYSEENYILEKYIDKKIRDIYESYYKNYNKAKISDKHCYYNHKNFFKTKFKHVNYLKEIFKEHLQKNKNSISSNKSQYDIRRFIYYSSKEDNEVINECHKDDDIMEDEKEKKESIGGKYIKNKNKNKGKNERENIDINKNKSKNKNEDKDEDEDKDENENENEIEIEIENEIENEVENEIENEDEDENEIENEDEDEDENINTLQKGKRIYKSHFIESHFSFEKLQHKIKLYIIKSTSFSKNDNTIKKCLSKIKKNPNIKNEIEIEFIGEIDNHINTASIKLECNTPGKKGGFIVYNIVIVDLDEAFIEITEPFSTISYKQFIKRKDKSFIGKLNNINTIYYYYKGFCEQYKPNTVIFKKNFKFNLNFYYYNIRSSLNEVQNKIKRKKKLLNGYNEKLNQNIINPDEASTSSTFINSNSNTSTNSDIIMNQNIRMNMPNSFLMSYNNNMNFGEEYKNSSNDNFSNIETSDIDISIDNNGFTSLNDIDSSSLTTPTRLEKKPSDLLREYLKLN